jgi:hypothetical protein
MNTYKYLLEKTDKDINYIRSYVYKNYIKTVIENNEDNENVRVMFISNRFKSDFSNHISFECNGLIAEYNTKSNNWKMLMVPMETFNSKKLVKKEIINLYNNNNYELCKVYDGTMINLYFYNNKWTISTNKAYDANNLIFINNKTYMDVFEEITTQYSDFNFDKLDKNKCYSLCMKYNKYHAFIENPFAPHNKIILFRSVDIAYLNTNFKLKINENENIGFPIAEKYNIQHYNNLESIYTLLNNEINRYKKEHKGAYYYPLFGFILRSNNCANSKEYSNILLESNLLSKIRNILYNHAFIKQLNFYNVLESTNNIQINKNFYNILNLTSLYIYLTKKDYNIFQILFPQLKEYIKTYDTFLRYLTKYIIKNCNVFSKNMNNIERILNNEIKTETNLINISMNINYKRLNKLVIIIMNDLKNKNINLDVIENYDILFDYLCNIKYIDHYYSYYN